MATNSFVKEEAKRQEIGTEDSKAFQKAKENTRRDFQCGICSKEYKSGPVLKMNKFGELA